MFSFVWIPIFTKFSLQNRVSFPNRLDLRPLSFRGFFSSTWTSKRGTMVSSLFTSVKSIPTMITSAKSKLGEFLPRHNVLFFLSSFRGCKSLKIYGLPPFGQFDIMKAFEKNTKLDRSQVKQIDFGQGIKSHALLYFYAYFPNLEYIRIPCNCEAMSHPKPLFTDFDFLLNMPSCKELDVLISNEFIPFLHKNKEKLSHIETISLSEIYEYRYDYDFSTVLPRILTYFKNIKIGTNFLYEITFQDLECQSIVLDTFAFEQSTFHFDTLKKLQTIVLTDEYEDAEVCELERLISFPNTIRVEYPKIFLVNHVDIVNLALKKLQTRAKKIDANLSFNAQDEMKTLHRDLTDLLTKMSTGFDGVIQRGAFRECMKIQCEIAQFSEFITFNLYEKNLETLQTRFPNFPFVTTLKSDKIKVVKDRSHDTMVCLLEGFDGKNHRIQVDFWRICQKIRINIISVYPR
jgi:hypothetical protein